MSSTTSLTTEERGAAAVAAARALAPSLRARAGELEQARRLSAETVTELRDAGLLGLLKPRRFGGEELGLATAFQVSRELARGCLSTAWVQSVYVAHELFLAQFPLAAQEQVHADPDALVSTVLRLGRATVEPVDGGFRMTGAEGRFSSGVDHAAWLIVGAETTAGERAFFLLPRREAAIVDDWHTVGMRGTGSKSIRIDDAFVPAAHAVPFAAMTAGTARGTAVHEGPLFRLPIDVAPQYTLAGCPLGGAQAALELVAASVRAKRAAPGPQGGAAQAPTIARLGELAGALDAAHAAVLRDAEQLDADPAPLLASPVEKARLLRNRTHAARTARLVVTEAFELGGGSALYDGNPIQRIWRDVSSACNHVGFTWAPAMSSYGQALVEEAGDDAR